MADNEDASPAGMLDQEVEQAFEGSPRAQVIGGIEGNLSAQHAAQDFRSLPSPDQRACDNPIGPYSPVFEATAYLQ